MVYDVNGNVLVQIDDTLTVANAAADAKATGDKVSELKSALSHIANSNVLWQKDSFSFYAAGNYPQTVLYSINAPALNDVYTFSFDSIEYASAANPMYARLYDANNMQIRSMAWHAVSQAITITQSDVNNGVDRVDIIFYPAQGTALTNPAIINNGLLVKGSSLQIEPTEYISGPIIDASVKTVNELSYNVYQITDDTIEVGDISSQTGANVPSTSRLRTKDYIPVAKGTDITSNDYMWLYYYDQTTQAYIGLDSAWEKTKSISYDCYIRIIFFSTNTELAKSTAFSNTPKVGKEIFMQKPLNIMSTVRSISHRGRYTQGFGVQCCASAYIESAKYGYKYAENDMQLTSDSEIVMWHDTTLALIGDSTHSIGDYTLAQLKAMDFLGDSILTLKEWLLLCKSLGMDCYIDDKIAEENYTNTVANKVVNTVKECGMVNNVTYIGHFAKIRDLQPNARLLILYPPTDAALEQYSEYLSGGEFVFGPATSELTAENASKALKLGFGVECYFTDFRSNGFTTQQDIFDEIMRLINIGVQGITLDFYKVEDAIRATYFPET